METSTQGSSITQDNFVGGKVEPGEGSEDFTDRERFAGEQNIAYIINVALLYSLARRDMMSDGIYIGIDGCNKGWIAAILDYGHLYIKRYGTIAEIIAEYPAPCTYLIDMPIGLPEQKGDLRPDEAARKELGSHGASVFPVPCRQAVYQHGQNSEETELLQKAAYLREPFGAVFCQTEWRGLTVQKECFIRNQAERAGAFATYQRRQNTQYIRTGEGTGVQTG